MLSLFTGIVILLQNKKKPLNIVFACVCLFLCLWSFAEFMYRQAESISVAQFWLKIRALTWTFPLPFLFHFILIFTRRAKWLKKKVTYILVYGPALVFSSIDFSTHLITGKPEKRSWGFSYGIPDSWVNWLCNGWAAALGILILILALLRYFQAAQITTKKQAKYIALGISLPILSGILSEIVLPELDVRIPELTSISGAWIALVIGYAIWKYELFSINPAMAAENIISTMNEMFFLLSPEGSIVRTNKMSQQILGYDEKELVGQSIGKVCGDEPAGCRLIEQVREQGSVQNIETVCRTKTGVGFPAISSGSVIKDRRGQILGIICVTRDITDRKHMEEELRALSLRDELTGLYNRRGFMVLSEHKQLVSKREGKEMLLIYVDVDGLKSINDTYGHAEGDAALVATARILKETFRSSDIIARLGGDEFVILVAEASGTCSEPVKTRLEDKIRSGTAKEAFPFALSLSLGIICCDPKSKCSIEELLAKADQAMYAHKRKK